MSSPASREDAGRAKGERSIPAFRDTVRDAQDLASAMWHIFIRSTIAVRPPARTIPPWTREPRRSETDERLCALLYDLEIEFRKVGGGDPAYIYDEEYDLFRFAFSREHADWGTA